MFFSGIGDELIQSSSLCLIPPVTDSLTAYCVRQLPKVTVVAIS